MPTVVAQLGTHCSEVCLWGAATVIVGRGSATHVTTAAADTTISLQQQQQQGLAWGSATMQVVLLLWPAPCLGIWQCGQLHGNTLHA